jgi:hypothetical protein
VDSDETGKVGRQRRGESTNQSKDEFHENNKVKALKGPEGSTLKGVEVCLEEKIRSHKEGTIWNLMEPEKAGSRKTAWRRKPKQINSPNRTVCLSLQMSDD